MSHSFSHYIDRKMQGQACANLASMSACEKESQCREALELLADMQHLSVIAWAMSPVAITNSANLKLMLRRSANGMRVHDASARDAGMLFVITNSADISTCKEGLPVA